MDSVKKRCQLSDFTIVVCAYKDCQLGFHSGEIAEIVSADACPVYRKVLPGTRFVMGYARYETCEVPIIALTSLAGKAPQKEYAKIIFLRDSMQSIPCGIAVGTSVKLINGSIEKIMLMPEYIQQRLRLPIYWGVYCEREEQVLLCSLQKVMYISDIAACLYQAKAKQKEGNNYGRQ